MQAIAMRYCMSTLEFYSVPSSQLEFPLMMSWNGNLERVRSH